MFDSVQFVLCLICAEYIVLGIMAGVAFRKDVKNWLQRKHLE